MVKFRSKPENLVERLDERVEGKLYLAAPRWLRRWLVGRFDRRLAAAGEKAVLRQGEG
jgi:hypothetical protein